MDKPYISKNPKLKCYLPAILKARCVASIIAIQIVFHWHFLPSSIHPTDLLCRMIAMGGEGGGKDVTSHYPFSAFFFLAAARE
jgi:hypothetical protein